MGDIIASVNDADWDPCAALSMPAFPASSTICEKQLGHSDPHLGHMPGGSGTVQWPNDGPSDDSTSEAKCTHVFHHSGCCEKGPGPATYKGGQS